ncbi:MAG TPA: DUF881 domain-containing protein [Jatrophihabitans sp.]|nr:DUF881 domain-containing protein [Jatrophihabitans sp.]
MTESRPDRLVSARLLIELVDNTLDPGYAAAAKRRGPDAPRRWYDRPAVIVGCLLIGFLLVVAYVHTHRSAPQVTKVHDSLVSRVRTAQHDADDLANQVNALEQRLAGEQDRALPKSAAQLSRAELAAGQLAVTGPGLTVTLSEPPAPTASPSSGRGGTVPIGATNILTDRDVRSVVNELWHDGAEAVSVNDIRLTPDSAIRFAGQAVLVDFQPINPPYRIRAIGDADGLATAFAASSVASRYQTLSGVEHIGFTFSESSHLTLPAGAPATPRYAKVARP